MLAAAGATGLAAYAASVAERLGLALGLGGAAAVIVLSAALALRAPGLIAPALGLLGAEYTGLFVIQGSAVDVRAPLYGAGFLAVAELSYATVELRAGTVEPGLVARRAATLVLLALGAIAVGTIAIAAGAAPASGGVALVAAGVAAAVVLMVVLGRLAVVSR